MTGDGRWPIQARLAGLVELVDEVAQPGWKSSPVWWALLGAVAVAEPYARPGAYLVSDAEPSADTFIGVPGPAPDDAAGRIGWAIAHAHAAVRAVLERDGTLPGQPLTVGIALHRGAARVIPIASPWRVAFVTGDRVVTALLDPRGPAHELDLARDLAAAVRGAPHADRTASGRAAIEDRIGARVAAFDDHAETPMVTVALGDDDLARAHHGHRRAWHKRGGPWLGVARAGGMTLLSTCHTVVDGWGHVHLAADVARHVDRTAARHLASAAAGIIGDAAIIGAPPALPAAAGGPLGVAWRRLPGPAARFTRQAWALGRVLDADAQAVRARTSPPDARGPRAGASPRDRALRARRSPTFQVPVAPGAPDDPTRFARRVRPALLSVRFSDNRPEPEAEFAARARVAIAREATGRGLTSRMLAALTAIPVPLGWQRGVVGARARWLDTALDVIAGAGCLSLLRVAAAPPLVAVSSPGRLLHGADPRATSVLTVIADADGSGATATLAGSGRATSPAAAAALLDAWCDALSSAASGGWRASRSNPSS